ncbi:response regulator, partial [Myxococcota bacterium]|nr:response regulator [Myxococcota bacterium]
MSKKLLVADDSKTIRRAVELTFSNDKEIELIFADDGQSALLMAKEKSPLAVLADHKLPGLDGYDLLAAMKQESSLSKIPVIILHSHHKSFDEIRGVGAEGGIPKPFLTDKLMDMVYGAIESADKAPAPEPQAQIIVIDAEFADDEEEFDLSFDAMGVKPAAPVAPAAPMRPAAPAMAPVAPVAPMRPAAPAMAPVAPSVPMRPAAPAMAPVSPARPAAPAAPARPAVPAAPARPAVPA